METQPVDETLAFMVDGNAVAGLLHEIFGVEMTAAHLECASCGKEGEVGSLWAFVESPGYDEVACPGTLVRIFLPVRYEPPSSLGRERLGLTT